MAATDRRGNTTDRAVMAAMGGVAGLALWVLADVLPDWLQNDRLVMFLAALAGSFFVALLAAFGPLRAPKAALAAGLVSVVPSLLFFWASFRFENVENYLETAHPLLAFAILVAVPLPFLIAALGPVGSWRDYPELFAQSWNIVGRYIAAWLFTGLFWAVILLSTALFGIIGLEILDDFLEIEPVPYLLSGLVLGLALAVVHELSDYVSPYLVLRLLRLLLPLVLVVVAIFLIMVPVRGLSGLFGDFSAAGILMAMAVGAATLVTTAIDQSDDEAIGMPFMRACVQALALVLPLLAGLAIYAIWTRVNQHGWSPDRLAAATIAVIVLGYAVLYAVAILGRSAWMARIRLFNTWMALIVVGVAVLWLTPMLNPQRISAQDQLGRFAEGKTSVEDLDLWTIGRTWGKAGRAVAPLFAEVEREDQPLVAEQLAALEAADSQWDYEKLLSGPHSDRMKVFLSRVKVRPEGAELPPEIFGNSGSPGSWLGSCDRETSGGNPGCVLLLADLLPDSDGTEVLLALKEEGNWVRAEMWSRGSEGDWRNHGGPLPLTGAGSFGNSDSLIDDIVAGRFALEPIMVPTLRFGDNRYMMSP